MWDQTIEIKCNIETVWPPKLALLAWVCQNENSDSHYKSSVLLQTLDNILQERKTKEILNLP